VLELIERRRNEVRSRISELQRLERDLDRLASQGAGVDPSECDPAGVCKVIPSDADRALSMQRGQVSSA